MICFNPNLFASYPKVFAFKQMNLVRNIEIKNPSNRYKSSWNDFKTYR